MGFITDLPSLLITSLRGEPTGAALLASTGHTDSPK